MSATKSYEKSDAIVVCCSYDLRVCDHACELVKEGRADTLVISGKSGNWTKHIWDSREAEVFYERALVNNIDESRIIKELRATNFGENVSNSKKLLPNAKTITFVSKPNSLLRVKLTAEVQWPEINALTSCPDIKFPEQVSNVIGVWGVINEMVGDIDRIQNYPNLGYQAEHELPERIIENWNYLVQNGFTYHLMPNKRM
jgi:uncharacterized SAM-binding protein YcdF (DUF218 family)